MSPGSSTESYPAFAHIGLRENPGKTVNQQGSVWRAVIDRPPRVTGPAAYISAGARGRSVRDEAAMPGCSKTPPPHNGFLEMRITENPMNTVVRYEPESSATPRTGCRHLVAVVVLLLVACLGFLVFGLLFRPDCSDGEYRPPGVMSGLCCFPATSEYASIPPGTSQYVCEGRVVVTNTLLLVATGRCRVLRRSLKLIAAYRRATSRVGAQSPNKQRAAAHAVSQAMQLSLVRHDPEEECGARHLKTGADIVTVAMATQTKEARETQRRYMCALHCRSCNQARVGLEFNFLRQSGDGQRRIDLAAQRR
ncbi:hypothetical protein ANN_07274 [Periplaneta americana]|uniref:Uncharacterized protein n=1 Tax=Periplaneta americana TaxID=6978 RepID=A0ABQ8TFS0_PERAM|nr:hypothetical protein ANN_07274 [Periplaneta americana]